MICNTGKSQSLCEQLEPISIEFLVDYSLEDSEDNLGALSPFIIDVDIDTTTALIRVEFRLKPDEKVLWKTLEESYYQNGVFAPSDEARDVISTNFSKLFELVIYAVNPKNPKETQIKKHKELEELFPFHIIPAERLLGEDGTQNSSLSSLISEFFEMNEEELDPNVAEKVKELRAIVENANKNVQKQSDSILSSLVNDSVGFGYPNGEELQLGVTTQLSIDDQIKNQTQLSYTAGTSNECLPSTYNGLGYKNLIKMEFLLAAFAKKIEKCGNACIPLLFIEEPESHMHPQMQHTLKILMITHKVLAAQQGYERLLNIINDGLRDKEDPFLLFFMDTVEPIYHALETLNMQLLFDTLGIKRYPITKKSEKEKWKIFQEKLREAREKRAIDVIEVINETKLIPFPPKLDGWYHLYHNASGTIYSSNASIQAFLELDYTQFISAIEFLYPEALFSTEHGVKGEEYDNVIFVISKGWNMYQFETYAPMITGKASIPSGKQISFERNRNLFYVCCSRPRKRLFFFVTVPIDRTFKEFLMELVGEENYYTYSQYIKKNIE